MILTALIYDVKDPKITPPRESRRKQRNRGTNQRLSRASKVVRSVLASDAEGSAIDRLLNLRK